MSYSDECSRQSKLKLKNDMKNLSICKSQE